MDLPLSRPRHLPITGALMTLIMWSGHMALAARLCHMPRRLPRRPGSRLHKRPGQALGDPPPPPPPRLATPPTLSGKYGGETRRDKVKRTNMCLRMSSQMSPFCHRRRRIAAAKSLPFRSEVSPEEPGRPGSGAGKDVRTRSPKAGTSGLRLQKKQAG